MLNPGSVAGWITAIFVVTGFIVFLRGGGGIALTHLREANEVLTETVKNQETKLHEQDRELSELRGRTDVSIAIASALVPILEWSSSHETRAQERHDTMLSQAKEQHDGAMRILELIAARLGPDPNGKETYQ